jgi:F-type H+-transporting ATPase subunit alpha
LRAVPVNKVKDFENDYLTVLELNHRDILDRLKKGEFNDEITGVLEKVAADVSRRFQA